MLKKQFVDKNKGTISKEKRKDYETRLKQTYMKKDVKKSFYSQYNKGSGHEISDGKFWAKISSSRLAFDLYSWRAAKEKFINFEFEKKLPGVWWKTNTAAGVPNMDVFFETDKEITFIESKFTEKPPLRIQLPEAYWVREDIYHTTKGEIRKVPLVVRYHNESKIADKFVNFYTKYLGKEIDKNEWFDFAQEMKHLFGIVFYVLEKKDFNDKKDICFYNIVYHFDEYESLDKSPQKIDKNDYECSKSKLAKKFVSEAETMINQIFKMKGLPNKFKYELRFVQSELKENGKQKAFGSEKTVQQIIKENYDL